MSHIITSQQLLSTSLHQGMGTQQSLKQSYLAQKIAKLNRMLEAYLAVLDKKSSEINEITQNIDKMHAQDTLSARQKTQLKNLIKARANIEQWLMTSKLMNHVNDLRTRIQVLTAAIDLKI